MREQFEAFLKEHGVYDEFISKARANLGEEELEKMFLEDEPGAWISSAFVWGEGEENEDMHASIKKWIHLNNEWEKVCENFQ